MANKKPRDPYKCDNGRESETLKGGLCSCLPNWLTHNNGDILGWFISLLERMGIMSKDPNCRFPWLVPWPVGTKRKCCPKKNDLPVMNPLEVKCVYKPLVKTGQIWIYMVRGTTIPKWARIERCIGKPCKKR